MDDTTEVVSQQKTKDFEKESVNGYFALFVFLAFGIAACIYFYFYSTNSFMWNVSFLVVVVVAMFLGLKGLMVVAPNEACACTLFGQYSGTVFNRGFCWINPFSSVHRVSTKVQNLVTKIIKINDGNGNPIEIGANIVWQVALPAKSVFDVEDVDSYVEQQCESSLRHISSHYPYEIERGSTGGDSLRGNADHVVERLKADVQERVLNAGVRIMDIRFSHLAYAPEIAHAMLRRQQADAVVSARTTIVEGAVGMVDMAIKKMEALGLTKFDDKEQARLITNMMTVLLSEEGAQPVVTLGSSE